ncbi:MAG: hypothetical protein ACTSXQ_04820 [Alphaproteobacteria bacterium]
MANKRIPAHEMFYIFNQLGFEDLKGNKVLSIGVNHAVKEAQMVQLGADHITAVEIDPEKMVTARQYLSDLTKSEKKVRRNGKKNHPLLITMQKFLS